MELNWQRVCELELRLLSLADEITSGTQTMTTIMLRNGLVPLVGKFADHPALRNDGAPRLADNHLDQLDHGPRRTTTPKEAKPSP